MNCVILQPSYIPWRGYFHQIAKADVFVFYDDVQFDKRGWRNRNQIKTSRGKQWLTIPVFSKGAQTEHIPINKIKIVWDSAWNTDHWKTIQMAYSKAPYFETYAPMLERLYNQHPEYLADFTIETTLILANALGINHTKFIRSSELNTSGHKTDHLIQVLRAVGASHYISGPSAQDYIENSKFEEAGITLEYMSYEYPEYTQLYPPFEPQVSILDLLFMTGPDALKYISG
ncbi:MAG: WbqC family protein [Anaerolineaceae bacterium]|nr:WbqC family protein [Anaerolineaceae bacterium]